MMTTAKRSTGVRNRSARAMVLAALSGAALAGAMLGGCVEPAARASVINTTDQTLSVAVWPADDQSERGAERTLTPGGATGYRFVFEEGEPSLAVWAQPEGGNAQLTTLEPPGPHLVEIRGGAAGLQFVVRRDPGSPSDRVPDDARRGGFNDDIPPVSPPPPL